MHIYSFIHIYIHTYLHTYSYAHIHIQVTTLAVAAPHPVLNNSKESIVKANHNLAKCVAGMWGAKVQCVQAMQSAPDIPQGKVLGGKLNGSPSDRS